jgi:hypothetical protein
MAARERRIVQIILAAGLALPLGCRSADPKSARDSLSADSGLLDPRSGEDRGGQLLRTGAIQLGPGVGKNAWGWQGDGKSGF